MKKFILLLPLLLLMLPISAQTDLGVSAGDSFTFKLVKFDVGEDMVTIYDDNDDDMVTFGEGESFTITIKDGNLIKEEGESRVLVEFTVNEKTVESLEYVEFGSFIVIPDWNEHRQMLNEMISAGEEDTPGFYSTVSLIDTDTEFGYTSHATISYSNTEGSTDGMVDFELRYEKSTGVITLLKSDVTFSSTHGTEIENEVQHLEVVRKGSQNDAGDVSLPGFEFLWVSSLFLIPIIRKFQ